MCNMILLHVTLYIIVNINKRIFIKNIIKFIGDNTFPGENQHGLDPEEAAQPSYLATLMKS